MSGQYEPNFTQGLRQVCLFLWVFTWERLLNLPRPDPSCLTVLRILSVFCSPNLPGNNLDDSQIVDVICKLHLFLSISEVSHISINFKIRLFSQNKNNNALGSVLSLLILIIALLNTRL